MFRLIKDRIFYIKVTIANMASKVPGEKLLSACMLVGKFTQNGKFRRNIICLDYLAKYCKHKIWVNSVEEMPYIFGNHVIKAHSARMTKNIPQYSPLCVFNINDLPLTLV